ncbi:hypothetical protein JXA85_02060 [Candidatus Woesearchaeota archaeon]|nr:hypothetical protein [Candidatus Woesearchaeota archaeon]
MSKYSINVEGKRILNDIIQSLEGATSDGKNYAAITLNKSEQELLQGTSVDIYNEDAHMFEKIPKKSMTMLPNVLPSVSMSSFTSS